MSSQQPCGLCHTCGKLLPGVPPGLPPEMTAACLTCFMSTWSRAIEQQQHVEPAPADTPARNTRSRTALKQRSKQG